jgi:aminopeptidase
LVHGDIVAYVLGSGAGIKKGEEVHLNFDAPALPLAVVIYETILAAGGHPIVKLNEDIFMKVFYSKASDEQLAFFPKEYTKSLIDTIDHRMYIMADRDPLFLRSVDPKKIMKANEQKVVVKKWLDDKEDKGELTWTLALYGTEGMAKEAGISLESYWKQIRKACFLDDPDPIAQWQKVFEQIEETRLKLNKLDIQKLHITAKKTDLWISLGEKRQWLGGSGQNIPSFEIFTSPDWRGTEGHIYFDFPLYRYGNIIKDIYLEFKGGKIVKATAGKNEKLLREMIAQDNADRIGEYSLTDRRFSHITAFMADTLYDENHGGKHGNTHLAIGSSYHEAYTGDMKRMKEADWDKLGFNSSPEHCDIIQAQDRVVTAHFKDRTSRVIYKDGEFTV